MDTALSICYIELHALALATLPGLEPGALDGFMNDQFYLTDLNLQYSADRLFI